MTGLDCYRLTEKEVQKSLKKLLTNETECDTINKSPRENESSEGRQGPWKLNNVRDKQEPVITLRSMYFLKIYNNAMR